MQFSYYRPCRKVLGDKALKLHHYIVVLGIVYEIPLTENNKGLRHLAWCFAHGKLKVRINATYKHLRKLKGYEKGYYGRDVTYTTKEYQKIVNRIIM